MDFGLNPIVVFDSSASARKSHSGASASEWRNFMSSNPSALFRKPSTKRSSEQVQPGEEKELFKKIVKDVEQLGTAQMTWTQRKAVETQKVIALGGKPPKNIKMPIDHAKSIREKRKLTKQAHMQEERLPERSAKNSKRTVKKRKMEDQVLKASEGFFKNGVLHVKPLTKDATKCDGSVYRIDRGKNRGKAKKIKGKKKR